MNRAGSGSSASRGRTLLADKAVSESYARLRYRDTSLLIWRQQQLQLERRTLGSGPGPGPDSFLGRSHSMWYRQFGNQPILVRDRSKLSPGSCPSTGPVPNPGHSRICLLM
ncbi:putative uncharacterized protein BRD3OS [Rhincodon typus]|uniref:putative uncharacterized protein BRD3OS n=1 Tax=Rhincodon typus TaxID=259920 RepID=UPI00202F3950|nr:putative uncharacterized protein BRD3OS [Rhincodon typus]